MNIYFIRLTLFNLASAAWSWLKGDQVYYFDASRPLKSPLLSRVFLKRFHEARYRVSEFHGLNFQIHRVALETAEDLYRHLVQENPMAVRLWERTFQSQRVHLYLKKLLAIKALQVIKVYMVLACKVQQGESSVQLVVPNSAFIRLLLGFFLPRYGDPRIPVRGLSSHPWSDMLEALRVGGARPAVLAISGWLISRRGVVLRGEKYPCKVSKEILWGIGSGRRTDDFFVDHRFIHPEDVVFYYRNTSAARLSKPEFLATSIAAAMAKGYKCVNFDRVPVPVGFLWRVLLPRYVRFPAILCQMTLARQIRHPSASVLHYVVMAFLLECIKWEAFLSGYAPRVNLSQDDFGAEHISATVALNLHGAQNAGFQYANLTQWRAVTCAYLGYNTYFAWGPFVEKYWRGNWGVDRVVHVGYIWGHLYLESSQNREAMRKVLLGDDQQHRFVVALFDEKPHPDHHISERVLHEFYELGVRLLERRPDTVVVVKPKGFDWLRDVPEIKRLLEKYVRAGRLTIWDKGSADTPGVIAVSDVVLSVAGGTPYLEAVCCGGMGLNYDPTGNRFPPFYEGALGKMTFDDPDKLREAIDSALENPSHDPTEGLKDLLSDLDPYRDFRAVERMCRVIAGIAGHCDVEQQALGVKGEPQG